MAVCLGKEFLIHDATVDEVIDACQKALREMGLKIIKRELTSEGRTTVLAGEGALVPLMMKALLVPLGLDDYVRAAQRSGVHIVISPSEDGIHLYVCGIALDEATGKLEKYTKEDIMEEVTDALEVWDFEDKFINKIKATFKIKEIK